VRDRTVKMLSRFLASKPSISDINLARLWKGLFYCTATVGR